MSASTTWNFPRVGREGPATQQDAPEHLHGGLASGSGLERRANETLSRGEVVFSQRDPTGELQGEATRGLLLGRGLQRRDQPGSVRRTAFDRIRVRGDEGRRLRARDRLPQAGDQPLRDIVVVERDGEAQHARVEVVRRPLHGDGPAQEPTGQLGLADRRGKVEAPDEGRLARQRILFERLDVGQHAGAKLLRLLTVPAPPGADERGHGALQAVLEARLAALGDLRLQIPLERGPVAATEHAHHVAALCGRIGRARELLRELQTALLLLLVDAQQCGEERGDAIVVPRLDFGRLRHGLGRLDIDAHGEGEQGAQNEAGLRLGVAHDRLERLATFGAVRIVLEPQEQVRAHERAFRSLVERAGVEDLQHDVVVGGAADGPQDAVPVVRVLQLPHEVERLTPLLAGQMVFRQGGEGGLLPPDAAGVFSQPLGAQLRLLLVLREDADVGHGVVVVVGLVGLVRGPGMDRGELQVLARLPQQALALRENRRDLQADICREEVCVGPRGVRIDQRGESAHRRGRGQALPPAVGREPAVVLDQREDPVGELGIGVGDRACEALRRLEVAVPQGELAEADD
ncbi:MAG: hypothetical protein ACYTF8_18140, partial [Planctomycetota bacterium]